MQQILAGTSSDFLDSWKKWSSLETGGEETTVVYSLSRNKTFDPVDCTLTGQTGFLLVSPQTASPPPRGSMAAHVSDCKLLQPRQCGQAYLQLRRQDINITLLKPAFVYRSVGGWQSNALDPPSWHSQWTPRECRLAVNRELMNIWIDLKWDLKCQLYKHGSADNTKLTVTTTPEHGAAAHIRILRAASMQNQMILLSAGLDFVQSQEFNI